MLLNGKHWLVRTHNGDFLGPYTQSELLKELKKKTFSEADEIASSAGLWISAQTLLNRDGDEFTQTCTRNTAVTQATHSNTQTPVIPGSQQIAPEELTPTPENAIPLNTAPPIKRTSQPQARPFNSKIFPIVGGMAVITVLWLLVNYLKPSPITNAVPKESTKTSSRPIARSPFVREMYRLIHSGQTGTALEKLTQYHETQASKKELEYLIPYSALLITEGESSARARKLLEKVLASSTDPQLKARTHHWLGYLMLSQKERDMGESHFLESLLLNPKDAAARFNLGGAYLKQERYRKALDYFQLAELEVPNLWLVHIYKGWAKIKLNMIDEANQSFKKAIALSKDRWISYFYYAHFLVTSMGKQDEAQKIIKGMLRRDPNYEKNCPTPLGFFHKQANYAVYLNNFKNIMHGSSGEEREMGKLYINYLLNGPASREASKIETLANKGSLMSKVLALKVILERDSSSTGIKKAIERLPRHLSDFGYYAYVLRGEAYMRLGRLDEAARDFQTAKTLEPYAAVSHWAYATLLHKTSRTDKARKEIENLLVYHPNYIPAIVSSQNF